jgi:hypothetical protein
MGMETFDREEKNMQKKRILSDAELIKDGADISSQGGIVATEKQKDDARKEMGEHFYEEAKSLKLDAEEKSHETRKLLDKLHIRREVNGTELELYWDQVGDCYGVYFPQINANLNAEVRISEDEKIALNFFDKVVELAKKEKDPGEIAKKAYEMSKEPE